MRIAILYTGIDYTHAAFGGPGTVEAYSCSPWSGTGSRRPDNRSTGSVAGRFVSNRKGDRRLRFRR